MTAIPEFEEGKIRGVPGKLPSGEHVVWQGAPDMKAFARRALHSHKLAVYFLIILGWQVTTGLYDGKGGAEILAAVTFVGGGALLVFAMVYGYAWLVQRMTVYTLTNKRVIMRIGAALPVAFNFPYSQITSAGAKGWPDQTGSIALTLAEKTKISWLILWPHARPFKLSKPEPTLRCIPDMQAAADILATHLRAAHGLDEAPTVEPVAAANDGPSIQKPGQQTEVSYGPAANADDALPDLKTA